MVLRLSIVLAVTTAALAVAQAQQPPVPPAPPPGATAAPSGATAPKQDAPKQDTSSAAKPATPSGTSDYATQETYKTKNGGMYEPPAQRPASPAMDRKVYGRT